MSPSLTQNAEVALDFNTISLLDPSYAAWVGQLSAHEKAALGRIGKLVTLRALILSRLAQVISERKVQGGLRRVLLTQAKRLQWLSARRYEALGGAASVAVEAEAEEV